MELSECPRETRGSLKAQFGGDDFGLCARLTEAEQRFVQLQATQALAFVLAAGVALLSALLVLCVQTLNPEAVDSADVSASR